MIEIVITYNERPKPGETDLMIRGRGCGHPDFEGPDACSKHEMMVGQTISNSVTEFIQILRGRKAERIDTIERITPVKRKDG